MKKSSKASRAKKLARKSAGKSTSRKAASKKTAFKKASPIKKTRACAIQLYFWPTPNGVKITIMLEECKLPYEIIPVNISRGDQFKPEFLKISPNNRMPAIIDPNGPGGKPISVFESGAILQYLGRKTGKFYPADERGRVEVEEWMYWQVGNLGPISGQLNHFKNYADSKVEYAIKRFSDETHRLYRVLNTRLDGRDFLCGKYSLADMINWPWARGYARRGIEIAEFPHVKAWIDRMAKRPAVDKAAKVGEDLRSPDYSIANDAEAKKILFGQR